MKKRDYDNPDEYFINELLPDMPVPQERLKPWSGETRVVGKRLNRVDAYERVSGAAQYTYDVFLPDMLFAAVLRCPHAHAKVTKIDAGEAEKKPGVHAVLTPDSPGADIPWYGGRQPQSRLFDPHCRYEGDEVAAVVAETPYQAWDALEAIKVEYEILPFVVDAEDALKPDAPQLYEGGNLVSPPRVIKRGDVEKGFAEADFVVEETFTVGTHIHVTMETHGSVVRWDGDCLTVWDSTQGVYTVLFSVARALQLPLNKVRVICKYMGGGFGCKLEAGKYTIIAALFARATGKPVKIMLSREESFLCVGNRPGASITFKAGVKKDGTITALRMKSFGPAGAYASGGLSGYQTGELYLCDNVETEDGLAYINAGRARAMRAPGFPQCNWALEQMIDMMAEKIGMCPVEFRLKNAPDFSQLDEKRRPYTSTGLKQCLIEGAKAFGWDKSKSGKKENDHIRRGVGVSAGTWGYGIGGPPYTAVVRMFTDGGVTVSTGAMDIGTGTKTIIAMVIAEELGIEADQVRIDNADTATTPYAYSSGGSQTLPGAGPTVRNAAAEVKKQLFQWGSEDLGVAVEDLELRDGVVSSRSDPEKKKPVSEMFQSRSKLDVVGVGYCDPLPEDKVIRPFGAQFAEVEVNTLTGEVKLLRLLGAHDSGRVINRKTFDNQVFGGMTQGVGFGMTEHRVLDRQTGKMCNVNWHDYKIPTALDVPADHQALAIEPGDDECNVIGAKGLGEPPVIPTASAIANAVYDAIGIRPKDAPIFPPGILQLLSKPK
jgi:CO/xanthine dehydrogenase Mo-binding subunit